MQSESIRRNRKKIGRSGAFPLFGKSASQNPRDRASPLLPLQQKQCKKCFKEINIAMLKKATSIFLFYPRQWQFILFCDAFISIQNHSNAQIHFLLFLEIAKKNSRLHRIFARILTKRKNGDIIAVITMYGVFRRRPYIKTNSL